MSSAAKMLETVRAYETGNDVRQIVSSSEGGRAFRLLKRREENKERVENERANIENETKKRKFASIDQKFGGSSADDLEEEFKRQTVGLISVAEFKAKRQAIDDLIAGVQAKGKGDKHIRLQRKVNGNKLSFKDPDDDSDEEKDDDEDEDGEGSAPSKKAFGKDPSVNTSFLYDRDREMDILRKREELKQEYLAQQEVIKKENLEVTYSYWDGSGHRRVCHVQKGFTIGQFLQKAKSELEKTDFPELRAVTLDQLMYVKEDLIIPHGTSFYELIKEKARGKSGPLFNFDAVEELKPGDVRVEKTDSHAGKIVDRKWYERNKHIFPASRWEMYSKDKTFEKYTIADNELTRTITPTLRG
jgi:protein FAM50